VDRDTIVGIVVSQLAPASGEPVPVNLQQPPDGEVLPGAAEQAEEEVAMLPDGAEEGLLPFIIGLSGAGEQLLSPFVETLHQLVDDGVDKSIDVAVVQVEGRAVQPGRPGHLVDVDRCDVVILCERKQRIMDLPPGANGPRVRLRAHLPSLSPSISILWCPDNA